jgi:hypothetical protein
MPPLSCWIGLRSGPLVICCHSEHLAGFHAGVMA